MIDLRPAHTRGHTNRGWLDTWHTFSFADYYDPELISSQTPRGCPARADKMALVTK